MSVQQEFVGEQSLCANYMAEKYVQEEFLGEEKSFWVKSIGVKKW